MVDVHVIGVDLGATWIRAAISDAKGNILCKKAEKTWKGKNGEMIGKQILAIITSLMEETGVSDITAVGIGSIGPIDMRKGIIVEPANLPFRSVPLVKPISSRLNVPVYLVNDCTAAVIGERTFGAGKTEMNLVYVTLSTGIGGGAYVNGHLLLGKDGNAVEIGHTVIDFEGHLICGCGKRGHWEAYCSGANIPNFARLLMENMNRVNVEKSLLFKLIKGDFSNLTTEIIFRAANEGDGLSLHIVKEIGRLNAIGFANIINIYDPSLITVGGSIALNNPKLILEPIKKHIEDYAVNRIPKIILTPLSDDIVLYGAVALALNPSQIDWRNID